MFRRCIAYIVAGSLLVVQLSCSKKDEGRTDCSSRTKSRVLRALGVDPTNDAIVYAGVEGYGIYKTTNAGQAWTKIVKGISDNPLVDGSSCYNEFRDISISPQNTQKLCVSHSGGPMTPTEPIFGVHMGPYCSSDGGANWVRGVAGLDNVAGYSLKLDPTNSDTVYYGVGDDPAGTGSTTGVIYKSTDFGVNWTELNTAYTAGQTSNRIEIHPTNSSKLYSALAVLVPAASGVEGTRYGTNQNGVWTSADAGSVWTYASDGMATVSALQKAITEISLSVGNPSRLFASSVDFANTVRSYFSHDAGATFTATGNYQVDYAEFDPNDVTGNILLGISYGVVIRSIDGGVNWNLYGTTPSIGSGEHFSSFRWGQSSDVVYLGAGKGRVYRSANAGLTWTQILSVETLPN